MKIEQHYAEIYDNDCDNENVIELLVSIKPYKNGNWLKTMVFNRSFFKGYKLDINDKFLIQYCGSEIISITPVSKDISHLFTPTDFFEGIELNKFFTP